MIIIGFSVLMMYVLYQVVRHRSIPWSISDTHYSNSIKWLFSVTLLLSSILILPSALDVVDESYQFLMFLTIVGLLAVAVSPNFKNEFENRIHMFGAILAVIMSLILSLILSFHSTIYCYLSLLTGNLIAMIVFLNITPRNFSCKDLLQFLRPIFWVEITALMALLMALL